ncbi:MAG: PEP-utilizing enzyme [Acidimicrobiales bacterium]
MSDVRWIENHPYGERTPFWTRANVGEVLPKPPRPLSWDLGWANGGCVAGWRDCAVQRLGVEDHELIADRDRCDFVGLIGGYGYLGATWIRLWAERTPGMSAADIDAAYFGDHPDVPPYVPEPWHDNPHTTEVMTRYLEWVMGGMDQSELEGQRLQARQVRAERPDLAALSDQALLDRARSLRPVCRDMFNMHINQSGAASIGPGVIGAVCAAVGRPEATMRLLAGLGGVDSAAPSFALWKLSRHVRSDPALTAQFDAGISGLHQRLVDDGKAAGFLADLREFLEEYGSRGPNEWDIAWETWETDPDLALALIDPMRHQGEEADPTTANAAREQERRQLGEEIAGLLAGDPVTLAQFQAALASSSVFIPGRERSKTNIIRVINEIRVAVREIGRRAVERGQLDDPIDLCLLFEDEVQALIDGSLDDITGLLAGRNEHYEYLLTLEPPFIINGPPPPHSEWKRRGEREISVAEPGEVIQGVPGCPGTFRGRARVVLHPSQGGELEAGDVLVAPHTDPAWTPLFVPSGGVVVDVGAALSHAIIVSRELGIPCVVSATDATARIPDGATVEVNGDTGQVTVIDLP